ncbi:MAG: HNH endonuclease [Peptostreptococcaceae bacterium]
MDKLELTKWLKELRSSGQMNKFYKSAEWRKLRLEVLKEDHNECQWCKKVGKITKATTVHHMQFVDKHPDLALSKHYYYQNKEYKNLISLCSDCHYQAHHKTLKKPFKGYSNDEKW